MDRFSSRTAIVIILYEGINAGKSYISKAASFSSNLKARRTLACNKGAVLRDTQRGLPSVIHKLSGMASPTIASVAMHRSAEKNRINGVGIGVQVKSEHANTSALTCFWETSSSPYVHISDSQTYGCTRSPC